MSDARLGWDTIWAGREIRRAVLLTWTVAAFAIVPEGLAAPYARQLHGGTVLVALLLAANPAGNLASGVWARRWSEHHPARLLGPSPSWWCCPSRCAHSTRPPRSSSP